jgi:hypothetical protein
MVPGGGGSSRRHFFPNPLFGLPRVPNTHPPRVGDGLSLPYIGTASSTTQRDELEHRSRRFRLESKKGAAGVCRGRGWYRYVFYKYGVSIASFLIGLHIRHGCFSIRLFNLTSTTARAAKAAAMAAPAASFIGDKPPETRFLSHFGGGDACG